MAIEDGVAQDQIKSFVDRILRLKEEVKTFNADIREIYAEAKGNGFDKTILGKLVNYVEKRNADSNAVAEGEALFDLYLSAYYGVGTKVATHTHEAETEPQSAPQAAQGSDVAAEPVASRTIQPETANETTVKTTDGGSHESASEPAVIDHCRRHAQEPEDRINEVEVATTSAHIAAGEGAANAPAASNITTLTPKPLRPYCQNPGANCGGQGRKHCWKCEKAHEGEVA